ncbi:hypothetical protein ASC92_22800 [Variovorax sp. Root411]|nr:hypothetical protein ASC92_22800 [Variovorax sp. Root411]
MRMVVQETATSTGKGASKATTVASGAVVGAVVFAPMLIGAALAGMLTTSAHAQIVGAPNVPGNLRPTVLVAPNGVPVINVQTPSAAGVSRNIYNQFNVGANGAILNNSRTTVQTQLGGFIQGNPYLATGPARIILNEVNGGNPSQLRGYIEVGGSRAEVIIANPAGISVDGGGFINASRATLTTGTPQFNALGNLDSFLVRGGTITIDGAGLDASKTDYAAILARAVQANAGIWASELKVVTGANQVSADHSQVTPTTGTGATPTFALDVAALGGMYAGKIVLIGTEAGLGVRNAGTLQASPGATALAGAGQLVVTSAGRLENIGTIQATADANLSAVALANSGRVASGGNLKITTQGDLANALNGTGGTLEGARLELASTAGDIDNRGGTIRQTSNASLALSAPVLSNTGGGVIGLEPVAAPPSTPGTGSGGGTTTGGTTGPSTPTTGGGTNAGTATGGTLTPAPYVPPSPGTVTAAGTLRNDGGKIYAGGPITLQTADLVNNGGTLSVASMALNQPSFSNQGGTINVTGAFTANLGTFDNSSGTLRSGSLDITTSGDLNNQDGKLTSDSDANLSVGGKVDNTRGTVSATGALTAGVAGAVNNTSGTLVANNSVALTAASLDNTQGSIQSANANTQLAVANQLTNSGGTIGAGTDVSVQAGSLSNSGSIRGSNDTTLSVSDALTNDGSITAGRNTTVAAGSVASSTAGVLGAGVGNDGKLGAAGDLHVTASGALVANGTNLAAGNATLQGASVDLSSSQTSAASIAVTATQGNVTTSGATVVTPGTLSVTANAQPGQTLTNDAGKLNAGQLQINASNLANINTGEIVQTGSGTARVVVGGSLDNSGGIFSSNGDAVIAVGSLTNHKGTLQVAGSSNLDLTAAGQIDNSAGGVIFAGGNATLSTHGLNNDAGRITATGNLGIDADKSKAATNVGGTIAANGGTTVLAGSLDNTDGAVAAVNGNLAITTTGVTTNTRGAMQAGGDTVLTNAGLMNQAGKITGNNLLVNTTGKDLDNSSNGTLVATGSVTVRSGALNNESGLIQSGGALDIDTNGAKLTNTKAAGFTGGKGGIASGDTLTLTTGELDNTAGYIGAKGQLNASASRLAKNDGGQIVGESDVLLTTNGFQNNGGQVQAQGGLTIATAGATLDNTNGLLRANMDVVLSGATVTNSTTSAGDKGIEGKNVSIAAQSIVNKAGAVRADENVTLTSSATIDNTTGLVSAGKILTVEDPGATRSLAVINTGGTLLAGQKVVLDAGSVTWDGKLLSQGDMELTVTKDISFAAGSETIANNNLSITTSGDITNSGRLASGNDLTLSAKNINNTVTGDIAGKTTTLNASDTLTNRGVIDGGTTRINAGTLNNYGTGRIYGDTIAIAVGTLNNDAETINGVATAGTIAARTQLDIGAVALNNSNGALIFSGGDLAIGRELVNGKASGSADVLRNRAATIEATNDASIKVNVLENTNGGVTWTMQNGQAGAPRTEYALPGSSTRYAADQLVFVTVQGPSVDFEHLMGVLWPSFVSQAGGPNIGQFSGLLVPSSNYPLSLFSAYYANPPRNSSDLTGIRQVGTDFTETFTEPGAWYARTDPIWATFGVTPPPTDTPSGDAQTQAYLDAHKRLDTATAAFIADVYQNYARAYYSWTYSDSSTIPVLQTSAPARIIAGGKMDIAVGSGTNDMSQILAGRALNVTGGTIANRNLEVAGSQNRTGTQYYNDGSGDMPMPTPYNSSIPITVTLAAARQEGNVAVNGGGTGTGTLSVGQTNQGVASANGANAATPNGPSGTGPTAGAGAAGATVNPIIQVKLAASGATEQIVRTTAPSVMLPTASLFRTHAEASSRFLIETDPRFANYRNWLSSDYLLNNLGLDPNNTLKRLGDGFYEQRLVREQVAQLTGGRYLDGYDSDEKQYAALMDAGVTFARQYGLRPGIALSDAQMAQLTSDIVWLVEQTVTMPDGSTQRVLVPQVYVRVKNGDIDGSGALLAGKEVNIKLDGDLVNSGTVAGRKTVSITAENIQNLNGRISGDSVDLKARRDLNNIGGIIEADSKLRIEAGRDINVRTTMSSGMTLDFTPGALGMRGGTIVDRVAGLYVSNPKGELVASAGRDVNLIGALISNSGKEGTTDISAGRDVNLGTVATARQDASIRSAGNYRAEASTQEVGTRIETSGDISLSAKRDVNARAATINSSDGELSVAAKRDINIDAGQSTSALNEGLRTSGSDGKRTEQGSFNSTGVTGSSLGGKTVVLDAGNDIRIRGSNVVSDKGTELWAGNNVTIEAATQTRDSQYVREESRTGMFDGGSGWTWGRQDTRSTKKTDETIAVGSTVGSISGNVVIGAGNQYRQVGSDVIAARGDVSISARDVQIVEARETARSESTQSYSQSGITLGFKAPLIDMLRNLEDTSQAMKDTKDDRMKALGAASMALSGYSAYRDISQAAATGAGSGAVSAGATLTLGGSSSETTSTQSSNTSTGSRVLAGGDMFITATGGGQNSNILVRGSEISAGKNVSLAADNNVTLEAVANTREQSSTSRSSSASIGVGFTFGQSNGMTIEVAAGSQSGRDNGTDGAWTNTTVTAGRQVNITSGGDTTVRGATVSGSRVNADVGGNLHIETLQDTSTYHSQNSGGGFNATICAWYCYGDSGVSVNAHNMRGDGNFASATQQSGFLAGDGGFAVNVAGNTNLVGGVIGSTDTAVNGGRNSFATGSLTMTDLVNHDTFQGSGYSVGFSTSTSGSSSGSAGIGSKDVNRISTTQSGVSGISGNTAVRTGVDSTNALRQTNPGDAMRDIDAQIQITAQFGSQASKFGGAYANDKNAELLRQAAQTDDPAARQALIEEAAKWDEGGVYRAALHAAIGGLTGGTGGAIGAAMNSLSVPYIAAAINATELPPSVRAAAITVASASLGASVGGGLSGAATAFNEVMNNCLATKCLSIQWDKSAPGYHAYGPITSPILCNTSEAGCLEAAKKEFACNSAPGQQTCSTPGNMQENLVLVGGNKISQWLLSSGTVIINGTNDGHAFDDGYIMRYLDVDSKGNVRIMTVGAGVNKDWGEVPSKMVSQINSTAGTFMFNTLGVTNRANVLQQIRAGSIEFNN